MTGKRSFMVVVLLAGLVGGVALTASLDRSSPSTADEIAARPTVLPVGNSQERQTGGLPDFSVLAEAISPSVVNIATVSEEPAESGRRRSGKPESFEHFFPRRGPSRSLGSGFILDEEGYIVTNHHVIEGADRVTVIFADNTELEATLLGSDPDSDLAVLQGEDSGHILPPVSLGDSSSVRVGNIALAIGNPFGQEFTITSGIISAVGRTIRSGNSQFSIPQVIQTDAPINPGNSGGPLFDLSGEVIGINTAVSRAGQGIGFAVPIDMVTPFLDDLKNEGEIARGWLGVSLQPLDEELAKSLNAP